MTAPIQILEAALGYVARGWPVFPLGARSKVPVTKNGFKAATAEADQVRQWWSAHPAANIGIPTGRPETFDALDVDGPDGEATLAALVAAHGPLPTTREQRTGRGRQLLLASSGLPCSAGKLGLGLDTRGIGGYVVVPPSIHPTGAVYAWLDPSVPLAPAPAWLAEMLLRPEAAAPPHTHRETPLGSTTAYGRAALSAIAEEIAAAPEGSRNEKLNACAYRVGRLVGGGEIDEEDALESLLSAGSSCGLPPAEVQKTTRSGLAAGRKKPMSAPPRDLSSRPARREPGKLPPAPAAVAENVSRPEATPYAVDAHGRTIWNKRTADGWEPVPLANFSASIKEEVLVDDGAERRHVFVVEGTLAGGEVLEPIDVPSSQFAGLAWVTAGWGARAILHAGQAVRDRLREAIQVLSRPVHRVRFVHTGWRRFGDSWGYLHAGGVITSGEMRETFEVELGSLGELANLRLPAPPSPSDAGKVLREAVETFTALAPAEVIVPLLAAVFRAPLGEAVEIPGALFLVGRTGTFKSELAARAQQFFGAGFEARRLPAAWIDTPNSLERAAFAAKDALFVVDDFVPAGSTEEVRRQHANVERILRSVGNGSSRGRMNADGTLRARYRPRGLVISTAEDLPRGHSARARALLVEVEPGDVDVSRLTAAQRAGREGLFASAMAIYLRWLASRIDDLRQSGRARSEELRAEAYRAGDHRRTPEAVASFAWALEVLLECMQEVGAANAAEAGEWRAEWWRALVGAAQTHAAHLVEADPAQRWLRLLVAAFAAGRGHIRDSRTGGPPDGAEALGWRFVAHGGPNGPRSSLDPQGVPIGWRDVDEPGVFLEPDAAFAVVRRFSDEQGDPISFSQTAVYKRLRDGGHLVRCDAPHLTVRVQGLHGAGARLRLLHVRVPIGDATEDPEKVGPPSSRIVGQVGQLATGEAA